MLNQIINYSIKHKFHIFLFTLGLVGFGLYSWSQLTIGALPDITNNQVQVITTSRSLATEEVEKFITLPVELEMANLPGVKEIRSISKFGLSVVTVVFEEKMGTYLPRQLIAEKIKNAEEIIPSGFGKPSMGPVTTGLGEIYQYILDVKPGYEDRYSVEELRSFQDWIVRRQMSGIPGVVEVITWGGRLKTYEVSVNPKRLQSLNISISEVFQAMEENNSLTGGGYIEKTNEAYFIRTEGLVSSIKDINNIVVSTRKGQPIYIKDLAKVGYGFATRFGAITGNGEGEKVMGQIMMLKGSSSKDVIERVKTRAKSIESILPEGVFINPFLERSELIDRTSFTIAENLILGCLIVIFVVILLLGSVRSGLVVASVIPLSLLFALSLMYIFGVDANLMSLGAIDFGIIIDGAVIIVEYIAFKISSEMPNLSALSLVEQKGHKDRMAIEGTNKMMHSAIFGQIIIIIVFIPILSLSDVEGKMFRPMALTFCFALIGAMVLCFTYLPVMASLFIKPSKKQNFSHKIMISLQNRYKDILQLALKSKYIVLAFAGAILIFAFVIFGRMGGEFIPTLDEGDFVIQPELKAGMSLSKTIEMTTRIEDILKRFPEVNQVVSRIGAAEVPTDPMSMEESDVIITLNPKKEWTSAKSKDQLAEVFKESISVEIPGIELEFTQPVEMRFNELITGVRSDLAISIFGEDLDILHKKALEIKNAISNVEGASDIIVEKTAGLPQMIVDYDRNEIAKYGLTIKNLNEIIEMGFGGKSAGRIFEGEQQYDLVIKYEKESRNSIEDLKETMVDLPNSAQLPLKAFANIHYAKGPAKISRYNTKRRIAIGVNVRDRDLQSVVDDVKDIITNQINFPSGYKVEYGGQFENLESATNRLMVAVPISLFLIFVLLYLAFNSIKEVIIIYTAIPFSAVGGILLLYLRDMPFSISAGIGFIALFGIAVLNGIVLIEHFKELKKEGMDNKFDRIVKGATERLRPVLLTAAAAAFGFLPMAISTSAGAEVQRPLATVVIGGMFTATILTLLVLPILYFIFDKDRKAIKVNKTLLFLLLLPLLGIGQKAITIEEAVSIALEKNIDLQASAMEVTRLKHLVEAQKQFEKTGFTYSFDRNNASYINDIPIHVLEASQSFKHPSVNKANKKMALSTVQLKESSVEIDKIFITKIIHQSYWHIKYWDALIKEYAYLDSIYLNFENATNRKYELGEGNYLEKITANAKRQAILVELDQAEQNLQNSYQYLNQWLKEDEGFVIASMNLQKIPILGLDISNHPSVNYTSGLIKLTENQKQIVKASNLPEFNIAVLGGLDNFSQFNWYPGISVGIAVPLWKKANKAKIQAAQVDTEIKTLNLENQIQMLEYQSQQLTSELQVYNKALDQYQISGRLTKDELIKTADQLFKGGEIDFFQYTQTIENAYQIKIKYLKNLHLYNQTAIELNYLINKQS